MPEHMPDHRGGQLMANGIRKRHWKRTALGGHRRTMHGGYSRRPAIMNVTATAVKTTAAAVTTTTTTTTAIHPSGVGYAGATTAFSFTVD